MSLSLELPVLIDASTRAKFVQASTEAMTAAVYAKLDGMDYYSIKGSAGNAAVKALWDKAGKAGWKISSNGSVEFSSGTFRGDLVGGKVYFSALGLYGLKPGDIENDVVFTASKNSSARFVFDCFNSTVRIRMSASATSLADGECEIDFYMKENGSVGQYNFDGTANITWSKKGTQGLTKSFDVAAYEPGQYVEVMFKVSSATAGVGFNSVKAEVRLDEKNKYLPLCVDVIKL